MTKTICILFLAALSCSADVLTCAAPATTGFEDWQSPVSDRDNNDKKDQVCGLTFHTFAPYTFTAPSGYSETPFPQPAMYFDYAIADGGQFTIIDDGGQTSGQDILQVSNDGWLTWANVGAGITATAPAGTRIDFRLDVNAGTWQLYADPGWNIDHIGYGAVYTPGLPPPPPPGSEVPEPGSWVLAATGVGLTLIGTIRRRK